MATPASAATRILSLPREQLAAQYPWLHQLKYTLQYSKRGHPLNPTKQNWSLSMRNLFPPASILPALLKTSSKGGRVAYVVGTTASPEDGGGLPLESYICLSLTYYKGRTWCCLETGECIDRLDTQAARIGPDELNRIYASIAEATLRGHLTLPGPRATTPPPRSPTTPAQTSPSAAMTGPSILMPSTPPPFERPSSPPPAPAKRKRDGEARPSPLGFEFLGLDCGVTHRARKLLYLSTDMDSDAWDREHGRELHRAAIQVADEQLTAKDQGRFDGRYFPMGSVS